MSKRQIAAPALAILFMAGSVAAMALADLQPDPAAQLAPDAPAINALQPTSGPVGTQVTIMGNHLTGVTAVLFNPDREAPFAVVSDTQITATVPVGSTAGPIQLVTPTGTIKSMESFEVGQP